MTIKVNFPNYLEHLTQPKFGSFLYADHKSECIIEVGFLTKIFEEIKGLFGYVNNTSTQVLATRLTQIIKQHKRQIDFERLTVLMKVAERAHASKELAAKFSKLKRKVIQLEFKSLEKSVSSGDSALENTHGDPHKSLKEHYQDMLNTEKEDALKNSKVQLEVEELHDLPIPQEADFASDSQMTAWKVGKYVLGALVLVGSGLWLYSRQSKPPIEKEVPSVGPWVDAVRWGQNPNPEDVMCSRLPPWVDTARWSPNPKDTICFPLAPWVDTARWGENPRDSLCFSVVKSSRVELAKREQAQKEYIQFVRGIDLNKRPWEAKKVLAGGSFDERMYLANPEKYIDGLERKQLFLVDSDRCAFEDCAESYDKVKKSAESLKPKASKREGTNNPSEVQQLNQMTKEDFHHFIKKLDIKSENYEMLYELFLKPATKENHRLLSKQQIGDLISRISPNQYENLFEKDQWVTYTQDLDFSDRQFVNQEILGVLTKKKYLDHLSDVQLTSIIKRFCKEMVFLLDDFLKNLEETQRKRFISNLNDVELFRNKSFYSSVILNYADLLSDQMVKFLIDNDGFGLGVNIVYVKINREQFDRYIQQMRPSEIVEKEIEIQTYYKIKYRKSPPFPEFKSN